MSGHSKWHNIQGRKGKQDKTRSNLFTKAARAITIAAQTGGGDESMNFSLRLAIEKAKAVNMPKDNIERAIKRGTGELKDAAIIEEALYEAFGPHGVALVIEAMTDNKTRTVSEVKHILSKHGGTFAGPGAVQWQFEHRGVIRVASAMQKSIPDWDLFELQLIDAGVADIIQSEAGVEIFCPVIDFQKVLGLIERTGIAPEESALEWIAKDPVSIEEDAFQQLAELSDFLEDNDDVKAIYTNVR